MSGCKKFTLSVSCLEIVTVKMLLKRPACRMVFNYGSVIFFNRDRADSGLFSLCSSLFWSEIQTIK